MEFNPSPTRDNTIERMEKIGSIFYDGHKFIIQSADYIEHGWFIEIDGSVISLKEIPYAGGESVHIETFQTLAEAIEASNELF